MNVYRNARLSVALLALLSLNALCATPANDQRAPPPVAPTATQSATQTTPSPTQPDQATAPPATPATDTSATTGTAAATPAASDASSKEDIASPATATPVPAAAQPHPAGSHQAPPAIAAKPASTTPQQAAVVAQVANPTAASGFRLMTLSTNALLSRVSLADQAKQTLDLQYYEFQNDATGRLIALHLLQAADRGVKVRILLDDLNLKDEVRMFTALASNPNIQVRLFNPFASAEPGPVAKIAQFLLEFRRLNRRMHNKCFIADNDEMIIGGRNIGDSYFAAAADDNFRDLDVIAIGPVVPAATASFEAYWNSDAAHPISDYREKSDPATDLIALRTSLKKDARTFDASAYTQEAADDLPNGASADRPGKWFWGPATLVADQPGKIDAGPDRRDLRIGPELKALINGAKAEVLVISPYFVPSDQDVINFVAVVQRGVAFKVLTNSLASTDEVAVHEGYARHRRDLLHGGVQLYELKPAPGVTMAATDAGQSSGISLHAKAFVVDQRYTFIGSMNMDQRSKLLNTEMGVVVDSPPLAKAVAEFFRAATVPGNAYHVILGNRDGTQSSGLHWEATRNGKDVEYDHDPGAPLHRRLEVQMLKVLPIEGLL